jgi:hypothetical protein
VGLIVLVGGGDVGCCDIVVCDDDDSARWGVCTECCVANVYVACACVWPCKVY